MDVAKKSESDPPRIEVGPLEKGTRKVFAPTWALFTSFVSERFLDYRNYVYRGQTSSSWTLEPTLDRILRKLGKIDSAKVRANHLERFQFAVRGRRGSHPARLESENEWWALGQHHGLATPLLDWTASPYVAAFFAFANQPDETVERRVVFALSRTGVRSANAKLVAEHGRSAPLLEFVRPFSDENARLVSQGGLFTRTPDGVDIEEWVRTHLSAHTKSTLYRIEIPETERFQFLRNLNRMNINHLTLFPDLYGAGKYCTYDLEIEKY